MGSQIAMEAITVTIAFAQRNWSYWKGIDLVID